MDYELTAEEKVKKKAFERFCKEEIAPQAARFGSGDEDSQAILRGLVSRLGEGGYLGLSQPTALGGQGETLVLQTVFSELLAKVSPTVHLSAYTSGVHCGHLIAQFGRASQKRTFLKEILLGNRVAALARTEARGGLDLDGMETVARTEGDSFLLEGEKFFCVNGPMADLFLVFAYLDGRKGLDSGLCCFVVPRGAGDVWIGPAVEALGYRGLPVSSLVLKGVLLDKTSLLGDEGSGRLVLRESWQWDALGMASGSIGILEASLEAAFSYSQQRTSFGKPIASYQEVSFKLAEARAMLDTARLLSQKAAWMKQTQDPEADTLISCAKLYASEAATKCVGYALQVLGGKGVLKGTPMAELFLSAKSNEIGGGTSEMHRIQIARKILDSV